MGEAAISEVRNYMETCVNEIMRDIGKSLDCCACEHCQNDIRALALNLLPPKYVATRKGQLYSKIDSLRNQFSVDIITALTKAVAVVKMHPRHDL